MPRKWQRGFSRSCVTSVDIIIRGLGFVVGIRVTFRSAGVKGPDHDDAEWWSGVVKLQVLVVHTHEGPWRGILQWKCEHDHRDSDSARECASAERDSFEAEVESQEGSRAT